MASYKTKIARLNALLDAQEQVIQEYALEVQRLQAIIDPHAVIGADATTTAAQEQPQ